MAVPEAREALEKDPSYPSGHTAIGWGFALILTEIAPDRADEILARGRAFGESRIVCNHHWYSDVVWGRFMGAATVARLHADPTFRADMEAAKAEFAALRAKGLPPTRDCDGGSRGTGHGIPGQRRDRHRHPAGAGRHDAPACRSQQRPPAQGLPEGLRPGCDAHARTSR